PVAGPRARGDANLEIAGRTAHDLLAGEAVALQRVGDELALGIVQRHGPEPRRRRGAGHHDVAPAVERAALVVRRGNERDAVAGADRQLAGARYAGARV